VNFAWQNDTINFITISFQQKVSVQCICIQQYQTALITNTILYQYL